MVLSRNDKRKRKEGDLVDLVDSLAEVPKRTKIHAQRKFAQGAITPVYSPVTTPIKEKEKPKPSVFTELITHKRPNTEDFLTFLCFRGTSILPPNLNFFSASCRKDPKPQNVPTKSPPIPNPFAKTNGTCSKPMATPKSETQSTPTLSTHKGSSNKEKTANAPKKPSKPATPISKNIKLKTTSTAIQALKKKYQEQRLAKQRFKKFKPSTMKTRSCGPSVPLASDKIPISTAKLLLPKKALARFDTKRLGLRSTGPPKSERKSVPLKKSMVPQLKKKPVAKEDTSSIEPMPARSKKIPPKVLASKVLNKKTLQKSKKIDASRVTRSKADLPRPPSPNLARRPSRKTKEAAAVYMELLGRKLVSPDIENDDNMSLDSFPELPSARKIAQTENENKAKIKKAALPAKSKEIDKEKEKDKEKVKEREKRVPNNSANKSIKKKIVKPIVPLKSKRVTKVQKYHEVNSDEESINSEDLLAEAIKASKLTRRSAPVSINKEIKKVEKRNIRSSRSLVPKKSVEEKPSEIPVTESLVKNTETQITAKSNNKESNRPKDSVKEKTSAAEKRKREEKIKENLTKQKSDVVKNKNKGADTESEEESLDVKFKKLKQKKENEKKNSNNESTVKSTFEPNAPASKTSVVTVTATTKLAEEPKPQEVTTKISDDEESFRGFTKKSITKVLNSCQDHVKANNDLLVGIDTKMNVLKAHDILGAVAGLKDIKTTNVMLTFVKPIQDKIMSSVAVNAINPINASVKQEPDFQDMKVSSTSRSPLNIIDMPKSHGRKERVNMSTEQIEKWLNESSLAKEESKVEMESVSNFKYYTPASVPTTPKTPVVMEKPPSSHLSISPRIQHLVRPVNVTLSKLSDRLKKNSTTGLLSTSHISSVKPQLPIAMKAKPLASDNKVKETEKEKKEPAPPSVPPNRKMSKDSSVGEEPVDSDVVSKSDANSVSDSTEKKSLTSSPERKVFFHQRKPFLPKFKERGKPTSSNASAFSPENESSVYAFETEAEAPVSTPFRRKAREPAKDASAGVQEKNKPTSTQLTAAEGKSKSGEESTKVTESLNSPEEARKDDEKSPPLLERTTPKNFELPKNFADLTNVQVLPLDKLTTSWSNVNCSASIAVQVNFNDKKQQQQQQQQKQQQSTTAESNKESSALQKSTEISTQTDPNADNDDDDSGQLFYIPLQAVTRNGSAQGGQQLIQGVAVKLGTEGPNGPNQRVLLKAKLVTKPPISVARCPPIGTVQPTARTPHNVDQADMASTSTVDPEVIKAQIPSEKEVKTVGSKSTNKTCNTDKIIKSPKVKEKKIPADLIKVGKKTQSKTKLTGAHMPINKTTFPKSEKANEEPCLVEAPTFRPSEKDFQDPLEYIDKIRPIAEKFGICKVVPPSNFKPECKVSDDMRFTAYNHYVHRMLHRWGPNVKEMMAIKKYLATQNITLTQPPWIGGMEVDLPHLYQTVQTLGGLKEVIEKKKWQKVADGMKIPRSAQDRVTKLDDIYCKYLLPYDILSQDERDKLFKDVEADWARREKRERQETQSNDDEDDDEDISEEIEECIVKGRNMPLNAFYRIARNTQRMWFGETHRSQGEVEIDASADEVETAFWRHVVEKKRHVCVHAASIDSSGRGFGFSVAKNSPFGRHPWNLKILTNNTGSVLRALGPQMGVTVPTLHVGMLFSACCWYRDPHGLPWIEYLHTGAKKIWYGIPDEQNNTFREAITKMFPRHCKDKKIWLPSDTAMVPPAMLVSNGVPLCQTVQEPGQFIVVFPKAFTSSICTGYVVSESVYFAQPSWLETAEQVFQDLHDSCEPSIFSFERLLFSIINDFKSQIDVLKQILPTVIKVCDKEIKNREKLKELGLTNTEKLPSPESEKKGKNKKVIEEENDYECDTCRANLFVSLVSNPTDGSIFCLTHAIQYIEKKKQVLKNCTLMYTYSESELNDLIHKLKDRIEAKSKKTNQTKQAK